MSKRFLQSLPLLLCFTAGAAHAVGWSAGTTVSPTGYPDPTRGAQTNSVATNKNGTTVAAWDQYNYTGSGSYSVGVNVETAGRWSTPQTISVSAQGQYAYAPKATIAGDGTMIVVWYHDDASTRRIEAAIRPANSSTWTPPIVLAQGSLAGSPMPGSVKVVSNDAGQAWVAWSLYNGAHNQVSVAHYAGNGATNFESPVLLSPTDVDAVQPAVAINTFGDVAVAWSGSPYAMNSSPNTITMVKKGQMDTSFTAPISVAPVLSNYAGYQNSPELCLDANNLVTVTWMGSGIQGNSETANGVWSGPQTVIPASNSVSSFITPSLACDQMGNAVAAVTIFDASINVQRAQVWASTKNASGWSSPAKLTGLNPQKTEDIAASSVAYAPDGSMAFIGFIDHYNGVAKAIHRTATGWGTPYTVGKTTGVSSFAEMISTSAAANRKARILWKSKGGAIHLASDWQP